MNKFTLLYFAGVMAFASCKKSKEKLIVGTWKVTKAMQGTTDVTADCSKGPYTETYASYGACSLVSPREAISLMWIQGNTLGMALLF